MAVVSDAKTGELLALVSLPTYDDNVFGDDSREDELSALLKDPEQPFFHRAIAGNYPPGSTFKVISGLTLLENGLTPDTLVNCPATIVVGKKFQNAEGEVLGNVPFRKDFAASCNTAFVGQSRNITAQQLADTAAKVGYRKVDIGVPVFTGSVPIAKDETEKLRRAQAEVNLRCK